MVAIELIGNGFDSRFLQIFSDIKLFSVSALLRWFRIFFYWQKANVSVCLVVVLATR